MEQERAELERAYLGLGERWIAGLRVVQVVDPGLTAGFYSDMESVNRTLSEQLSSTAVSAFVVDLPATEAVERFSPVLQDGARRICNLAGRYSALFQTYGMLRTLEADGVDSYLFVSERGENTCERCAPTRFMTSPVFCTG